jgi:hypothetical protein
MKTDSIGLETGAVTSSDPTALNEQQMDKRLSESFGSREVSIKIQDTFHYLRCFKRDICLAAIFCWDFSFCGNPAKAPG